MDYRYELSSPDVIDKNAGRPINKNVLSHFSLIPPAQRS